MRSLFAALFAFSAFAVSPVVATAAEAVLIEFVSARCAPCRQMEPIVQTLGQSGVAVRSVDVDREPELTRRYGIQQTPTFIVVAEGRELTRLVGMQTSEELVTALSINPSGPWVDTGSKPVEYAPATRLAPLPSSLVPPSEPMPSLAVADAVQRAEAATVRLRVFDGHGHGAGTGTVIDVHGEEALVLTCGHLFRDTKGEGRIEVDLFVNGQTTTVAGQLIDYEADDRDIALVAIHPGVAIQAVRVISPKDLPTSGDVAFSFGCDRGADPTRRDTRITGVNKYNQHKAASNLEIQGAPIDGRSGGGLFDQQGRLIGVCNAADYDGDVGIYTGPGSVHWQLDRVQLTRLYQPSGNDVAPASLAIDEPTGSVTQSVWADQPDARIASLPTNPIAPSAASTAEVIVIIRDQANPAASPRVMTLTQPSADLMRMLQAQAAH